MRRYRKRFIAVTAVAAMLATVGIAGSAGAQDVILGPATATEVNQTVTMQIGPNRLPKNRWTPGTMRVRTKANFPAHEPRAPRTDRVHVWLDRNIRINTRGLPTCRPARLQNTDAPAARRACPPAIIGKGNANAWVAMPDSLKIPAPAPVTIFNGTPQRRKPVYLIHAYTTVPVPTTFVVPGVYERSRGAWGYELDFKVPLIAGGYGSLDFFDATTGRDLRNRMVSWRNRGQRGRQFYGYGRCTRGQLRIRAQFTYSTRTADDLPGEGMQRNANASSRCRG